MAPPGFSVPREAPPGFSTYEQQAGRFPRTPSGISLLLSLPFPNLSLQQLLFNLVNLKPLVAGNLVSNSSLNSILQEPPKGSCSSCGDGDFLEKGKPTNVLSVPGMGTRSGSNPQLCAFDDEARLWLLMQQPTYTEQDSNCPQIFMQQTPAVQKESRFPGHVAEHLSLLDSLYGYSSKRLDQCQKYETSSLSQQKLENGHSSNGYQYSLEELHRRNEVGMAEIQRNEKLGLNKYFSGYGDLMLSMSNSGDVYSKSIWDATLT